MPYIPGSPTETQGNFKIRGPPASPALDISKYVINDDNSFSQLSSAYITSTISQLNYWLIEFTVDLTKVTNDGFNLTGDDGLKITDSNSGYDIIRFDGIPLSNSGSQFEGYLGRFDIENNIEPTCPSNMSHCFLNYERTFNGSKIGNWNVSRVKNMSGMFDGSIALNKITL